MNRKSTGCSSGGRGDIERGSMMLEAAIFLPLLIVGVLTLGFSIRMVAASEGILHAGVDEARRLCFYAADLPWDPFFPGRLEERVAKETPSLDQVEVNRFWYLYQSGNYDSQISFRVDYRLRTRLPLGFLDAPEGSIDVLARGFVGRSTAGEALGFEAMERDADGNLVYVFPRDGERYHSADCRIIASYYRQAFLTEVMEKTLDPCSECLPEGGRTGMQVYYFPAYGECYHLGSCPAVKKYVVEMDKTQAEYRGYRPCLICGGH